MRLIRLSKRIGKPKILGDNSAMDISWAYGPGFRDGPEDYFCVKVDGDSHDVAVQFNIEEARRLKEQVDKFLAFVDEGQQMWYPGDFFKKLKKKKPRKYT